MLSVLLALWTLFSPSPQATLVFAGDAMQHQKQLDAALRPNGSYDYSTCFSALTPYISAADYAVVNLETPLGGAPYSGYPMFCTPDSYLTSLSDAGFDLMLSANNHILDRRDKGVERTIATLERTGTPWLGAWRNAAHRAAHLPFIRTVNGFRIAFLNYTYGTNGIKARSDVKIDYIDRDLMAHDIRAARNAGAELVAVCIHWGDEYRLLPNATQKSLADFLKREGVDMIIGGHPHVIQPMELTVNQHTGTPCLLVYSLGNFISAMRTADTRGGAMVKVTLARDLCGRAYVSSADYRLVMVKWPERQGENFAVVPAEYSPKSALARSQRDAFVGNATRIFNRHNINVPRDTTAIFPRLK